MCEVAILQPDLYDEEEIIAVCQTIFESMGDSLGVVAVNETEDRTKFEYDIFKSLDTQLDQLRPFVEQTKEDAIRYIIHGRLATHGEVTVENAHPIEIECEMCDVDYLLHNGVVYNHARDRNVHKSQGHNYVTEVDSEVIAHNYGGVPDEFDERGTENHKREPAFLLLNEERIFIHGSGYHLTENARMSRHNRPFGPDRSEDDYFRVILTPTEAE